jgi:hypothetical protein
LPGFEFSKSGNFYCYKYPWRQPKVSRTADLKANPGGF